MLRARFHYDDKLGWTQQINDTTEAYRFRVQSIKTINDLEQTVATSQRTLNLEHGPVFSVDLCEKQDGQLLFMVAHHLIVDVVSWRIIIHDLGEILQGRTLPGAHSLPFPSWCRLQVEYSQQKKLTPSEVLPFETPKPDWSYWGLEAGAYTQAEKVSCPIQLDERTTTQFLSVSNRALNTEPVEIILAALFSSFHQIFTDRGVPVIFNESHGREPWDASIDLTETVGWFTTMTPLHVPVDNTDPVDILKHTKDRRRQTPGRGLPYFTTRYLTAHGREAFASHDQTEILFNYTGRHQELAEDDNMFQIEDLGTLPNSGHLSGFGARIKQTAVFDITARIKENNLEVDFGFSPHNQRQVGIQQWIVNFRKSLNELTTRLTDMDRKFTLSDFALSDLTYDKIAKLERDLPRRLGIASLTEIEDIYPCSPIQQGILISQARSPEAYQIRNIHKVKSVIKNDRVDMNRSVTSHLFLHSSLFLK